LLQARLSPNLTLPRNPRAYLIITGDLLQDSVKLRPNDQRDQKTAVLA